MKANLFIKKAKHLILNPFLIILLAFLVFLTYRYNKSDTQKVEYACMQFDSTKHIEQVIVCNNDVYVDFFTRKLISDGKESSRLPNFTTNLKQDSVAIRMDSQLFSLASLHLGGRLNPNWLIQWNAWGDINIMGIPFLSFLFIALGVIFWKQNLQLKKEREIKGWLIQEREKERLQISQQLHDGPIQELQALRMLMQSGNIASSAKIQELNNLQDTIENNLRNVCYELRPPSLEHFTLDKNIGFLVQRLKKEYPDIVFQTDLAIESPVLPSQVKLVYYRTAQEGLRNALKHANPRQIQISFLCNQQSVSLKIHNDGETFIVPNDWSEITRTGHFGMMDMQERANYVGAKLSIHSSPQTGTTLSLHHKLS